LSDHCEEGHAYRVDLRLRPYGRAGRLVYGTNNLHDYYARQASLWEIQALIKMRPVAGNTELGSQLAAMLRPVLLQGFDRQAIISSVDGMRKKSISQIKSSEPHADIKNGPGCMRDIEFAVQGLQLIFCQNHRELICGNTLSAIDLLCQLGIVGESTAKAIHDSYIFLRRVEHVMQIFDDRQIHSLPQDEKAVAALAKRIFGHEAGSGMLVSALEKSREAVQDFYANVFLAMR
jgi:glutamate-ammonia-ligase adenylyltransferase